MKKTTLAMNLTVMAAILALSYSVSARESTSKTEPEKSSASVAQTYLPSTVTPSGEDSQRNGPVPSTSLAGEQLDWYVVSNGGTDGTSANYQLLGTVSQTAVGSGGSADILVRHGFWQEFGSGGSGCCGIYTDGISGNTNCSVDGKLTLSDITQMIDHVYISKGPLCCSAAGNTNGSVDCKVTLSDITRLIDAVYISKGLPEPCMSACEE